ncbi:Uba1 gene product-related, related, partial [Eimeria tenella]
NYSIGSCSREKAQQIAGRIVPALATTTAAVTGLVALELLKLAAAAARCCSSYKNAFLNLALPLLLFSEPMPPIRHVDKDYDPIAGGPVRAIPQGFTCWDKIEVDIPNCRVKDLVMFLEKKFNVSEQQQLLARLLRMLQPRKSSRNTTSFSPFLLLVLLLYSSSSSNSN